MNAAAQEAPYTLRHIEEMLGLPRRAVMGLIDAGFVQPRRGPRKEYRFTFQDVVLLRTAHHLRAAQVPPQRLLRSLKALRAKLPASAPLSGLRIKAIGNEVAVRAGDAHWETGSGQLLMDFEVAAGQGSVTFLEHGRDAAVPLPPSRTGPSSADALFRAAEQIEARDAAAAEQGYRQVLALDATHADATINLSALLCGSGRSGEAAALCRAALQRHGDEPLLHFNLAIALEDLQQPLPAVDHYAACLTLDPRQADAHFNAARLLESLGRRQEALRHYSAYRRLVREG